MEFKKCIPDDYYLLKIVNKFEDVDISQNDYNTNIHERNKVIQGKLSLNHIELIEYFVRLLKPNNFLELGIQFGECTKEIIDLIPGNYYAVDCNKTENIYYFLNNKKNFKFFCSTTDTFFSDLNRGGVNLKLDMAFIDACHSHETSYNDFLNISKHVNEDAIIFLHDTYPASEYWTDVELCNDCYKTAELIRKNHNNEFEIITLPVNPGISIVRKCKKQMVWLKD